jgi:hypothetical protein
MSQTRPVTIHPLPFPIPFKTALSNFFMRVFPLFCFPSICLSPFCLPSPLTSPPDTQGITSQDRQGTLLFTSEHRGMYACTSEYRLYAYRVSMRALGSCIVGSSSNSSFGPSHGLNPPTTDPYTGKEPMLTSDTGTGTGMGRGRGTATGD